MIKVGIAGTGAIGGTIAKALDDTKIPRFVLAGIAARSEGSYDALASQLSAAPPKLPMADLAKRCDWVIEALPPQLFGDLAEIVLSEGKTLVAMSCSQLLGRSDLIRLAEKCGGRIVVPSGAMLGLDALKAVAVGTIHSVTIETRKPVAGLINAPFVKTSGLDLSGIGEAMKIFEGSIVEAAKCFPANVNVAAAISLAGIGPEATRMEVWADPKLQRNQHTVRVRSDSSNFSVMIENQPTSINPATGIIAPQSVIALMRKETATLQVGT